MGLTLVHVSTGGRSDRAAGIMVGMPPDQQPASSAPISPEAVVEFGAGPDEPSRPPRRRWNLSGFAAGLVADRRLVPLAAVLGGVALFASLVSEWQVTLLDTTEFQSSVSGLQPIPTDLIDLGGWAAGYLIGLFLLVGATVLVLFGPPPGRRYARLLGLSTGGVLLGLLAALTPTLNDVSRTLGYAIRFQVAENHVQQSAGRGVWCAFAGVAAMMLALYLAGRHEPAVVAETAAVDGGPVAETPPAVWSWRRPSPTDEEDRPPAAPFDLKVTSTTPFSTLNDDRDEPTGRDGISG
jgi:hypothetical protein